MTTLKAALLGKDLRHSISDVLHKELFKIIGPKYSSADTSIEYSLIELPTTSELDHWLVNAFDNGYAGANITYPYKDMAAKVSSKQIGPSLAIQSSNTIRFHSEGSVSTSTDGLGFINALQREYPNFNLEPYHLIVVGDGAAAKAVVYALCMTWMPLSLTIASRNRATATTLAEFCTAKAQGPSVDVMSIEDLNRAFPDAHHRFIIQATPVGEWNNPGNLLNNFHWNELDFAADLIYNPLQTDFLNKAAARGAKTINGLGMLIEQAALSQIFWVSGEAKETSPLTTDEYLYIRSFCEQILQK